MCRFFVREIWCVNFIYCFVVILVGNENGVKGNVVYGVIGFFYYIFNGF